jgi:integrase
MDRQEIFERIKDAKAALKSTHPDAASVDTETNSKSTAQYEQTVRNLFGKCPDTGKIILPTDPATVIAEVHKRAGTLSTLRKYARSVRYAALKLLNHNLKRADQAQRAKNWAEVERIVSSPEFNAYTVLSAMMPTDYRNNWKPERKRKGKKSSLRNLSADWREQLANAVHGKYRNAAIVTILTGCRPAELQMGITITHKDGQLYASINGAKVTKKAGQETREFRIANHPVAKILMQIMDESDETHDQIIVKVDRGNSVTTHIRATAKKLWPKHKESITVYSLRHAMAADCKKAKQNAEDTGVDVDEDLVSKVLGHCVDKTASYYGSISQSAGNSVAPMGVVVPKVIKQKVSARNKQRVIKRGLIKNSGLGTR